MKTTTFNLLSAIFLWLISCCIVAAQTPGAQSDQITQDQQIIQDNDSTNGKFAPVTVDPSATTDVALQFSVSLANKTVVVEAPDGGQLSVGDSATIDASGNLAFSYQVGDQPGVYRIVVIDPNASEDTPAVVGIVQYQVPPPPE